MVVRLVDEQNELVREPYVVRLGGWSMDRYLDESPDSQRWEFVRGEVVMYSPATAEHQDLVRFLLRVVDGYCEARGWGKALMGPAAVQILPDVVREPDLFVLAPEDVPNATGTPLPVRPALVIEVVSPSTRTIDLREKAEDYAQAAIPEYWAVDQEQRELWVHRLEAERGSYRVERFRQGRVESRSVAGLWLALEWLFQRPLPPAQECLAKIVG